MAAENKMSAPSASVFHVASGTMGRVRDKERNVTQSQHTVEEGSGWGNSTGQSTICNSTPLSRTAVTVRARRNTTSTKNNQRSQSDSVIQSQASPISRVITIQIQVSKTIIFTSNISEKQRESEKRSSSQRAEISRAHGPEADITVQSSQKQ